MKRIGFLMEKLMTEQNFVKAERLLGKNKRYNRKAKKISAKAEKYGKRLFELVKSGRFHFHKNREITIHDSYKGKTRNLKIPCLMDQAVQLAWLNIATPYIEKKNYYYNCGSVPGAGQTRSVKAIKKWLRNPANKYGAVTDIRKFYDTCPHSVIRRGLERIFKDRDFVDFGMAIVGSMSDDGVGIAIGFPSSHWFANIALMELDHQIKQRFPKVMYTRYMDDMGLVSSNRRRLRRAVEFIKATIEEYGMRLKKWSVFVISGRGLTFLSYRFFFRKTIMCKKLMFRISRKVKKTSVNMSALNAKAMISYFGILKWCDSFNFRKDRVYPFVSFRTLKKIISKADKRRTA